LLSWDSPFYLKIIWFNTVSLITTPIYLESIYNNTNIFCKIIAPPAVQPVDKRWPDVEVVIKVGY
jgi:hypothetical protein